MPELPEVETVKRGLEELIIGRTIRRVVVHDSPKSFPNSPGDTAAFVENSNIIAVRRRAKVLMIDLSTGYTLVIHLKMTGQLVFVGEQRFGAGHPTDSLVNKLPDRSTRVTLQLNDGGSLYFNDQRRFGWMKLLPTAEVPNMPFMQKVGPEPLEADFTRQEFAQRFARRANTSIKAALLDQTVVAGVGNIYADESLWGAKIDPRRKVKDVSAKEFSLLYDKLRDVMNLAIEKGGSTDRNYVNAEGKRGSYMDFAKVFRREGQVCERCGSVIEKIKHAGRGTHFCSNCQV
ncbi:bifunctional DNA-formamidopyrimidine glycosylase/DNA-(apurinic or apyrimidinic site) lyase [Candidatus Saccharibacteria bacterium]|jgi:formamidopyrimidine-DNA glycosylase|nr:bifunctional DNA-formamidopyrimidine glycosylase/DNA-(apurinic or apyrimidinic site) lyase [Candidatus Saccharibacteria bacterium]